MSESRTGKLINRIIIKDGIDVNIRRRTETVDDDGDVTYTYPDTIRVRAHVNELTGYQEFWESIGIKEEADYLLTFKAGTKVNNGDLIQLDSGEEMVISNKIERKTGSKIDYIECLCRKRK